MTELSEEEFEKCIKDFKDKLRGSLIHAGKEGVSIQKLVKEYRSDWNDEFPTQRLSFSDDVELLQYCSDTVLLIPVQGKLHAVIVPDKTTGHVTALVNATVQKKKKTTKSASGRGGSHANSGNTSRRQNSRSQWSRSQGNHGSRAAPTQNFGGSQPTRAPLSEEYYGIQWNRTRSSRGYQGDQYNRSLPQQGRNDYTRGHQGSNDYARDHQGLNGYTRGYQSSNDYNRGYQHGSNDYARRHQGSSDYTRGYQYDSNDHTHGYQSSNDCTRGQQHDSNDYDRGYQNSYDCTRRYQQGSNSSRMSYSDERNGYIESRPPSSMEDKTRFSDFGNDGLDSREEAKSSLLNNRATEEIPTLPNSHVSEIPASPNCSLVDSTTTEDIPTLPNSHVTEIPASPSCSSANDAATEGICSSEEPLILTRETFISMVRELRHCTLDELKARFNDTYGLPIDSKLLNLIFGCSCRSVLSAIKVGLEGVVEVDGNVITALGFPEEVPLGNQSSEGAGASDAIAPAVNSSTSSSHTGDNKREQSQSDAEEQISFQRSFYRRDPWDCCVDSVSVDFQQSLFPSAEVSIEMDSGENDYGAEICEFLSRAYDIVKNSNGCRIDFDSLRSELDEQGLPCMICAGLLDSLEGDNHFGIEYVGDFIYITVL